VYGGGIPGETRDEIPPLVDSPPPAPGFRRSAALLHQITFLVKPPYVNYVVCGFSAPPPDHLMIPSKIMRPAPLDDFGVTIPDFYGKSTHSINLYRDAESFYIIGQNEFLVMRRRGKYGAHSLGLGKPNLPPRLALYSADPAAVHIMYGMLLSFSITFDIPSDQLRQQLEREYELPVDLDANLSMDPPTPEERKRALYFVCLKQMVRLHERSGLSLPLYIYLPILTQIW